MKKKKITGSVLLTAVALLSSLIIIVPLLIVIFGSFKDAPEAQAFSLALPSSWHFENYSVVIQKGNM